jgi:hypothetical protein
LELFWPVQHLRQSKRAKHITAKPRSLARPMSPALNRSKTHRVQSSAFELLQLTSGSNRDGLAATISSAAIRPSPDALQDFEITEQIHQVRNLRAPATASERRSPQTGFGITGAPGTCERMRSIVSLSVYPVTKTIGTSHASRSLRASSMPSRPPSRFTSIRTTSGRLRFARERA